MAGVLDGGVPLAHAREIARRVEERAEPLVLGGLAGARDTWMRPVWSPPPAGRAASRLRSATSAQRVAISVSRPSGSPRPKSAAMCPASRRRTRPPQRSMMLAALSTTAAGVSRGSSMTSAVTSRRSPISAARSIAAKRCPVRDAHARRLARRRDLDGRALGRRGWPARPRASAPGAQDARRPRSSRGSARGTPRGRARRSGCPARRGTRAAPRTCARRRGSGRPGSLAIAVFRMATSSAGRRGAGARPAGTRTPARGAGSRTWSAR